MLGLDRITLTGADDSVEPGQIVDLARRYPMAELGILFGNRWGTHRFPSQGWVDELARLAAATPIRLSGHLCGTYARDFLTQTYPAVPFEHLWSRLQINTHAEEHPVLLPRLAKTLERFARKHVQVIFQRDGVNDDLFEWAGTKRGTNVATLFDLSHGAGVLPDHWPRSIPDAYCGYAGGLSPDNVAENLEKISQACPVGPYWIDVETHLYTDQKFDLVKAESYLERATEYSAAWQKKHTPHQLIDL